MVLNRSVHCGKIILPETSIEASPVQDYIALAIGMADVSAEIIRLKPVL